MFISMLDGLDDELSDLLGLPGFTIKDRDHTLSVPIDLKYAYNFNDNFRVYAFAGPRVAVGVAFYNVAKFQGESEKSDDMYGEDGMYSRFDLQLGLGAGIQYKRVSLELGYDWGMLNRIKSEYTDGEGSMKRNIFTVGLGVSF